MGAWGFKLYQNDTTLDVKDAFTELYRECKSVKQITDKLIIEYKDIISDVDEGPLFWFALADTQWDMGVLIPMVKEKALYWIDKCRSRLNFQSADISEKKSKQKTLDNLQTKLLSPQPEAKRVVKRRTYKCEWNIGDVFAYRLESDMARERGLYGRYFLIQKVDEHVYHPGHIVPIIYVKITDDTNIPSNEGEYNALEYVQTSFLKYEQRCWPIDMSRPEEDIAEKAKINYQVDEYGFLPVYRVILANTSKKVIPTRLIYIGNFKNVLPPQNEFIPHSKLNIGVTYWKNFDDTFETEMIKKYCGHNLRELIIYKK